MNEPTDAFDVIERATRPADLFGTAVDADAQADARRRYRRLVGLVHPDVVDRRHADRAAAVIGRLVKLYRQYVDAGAAAGITLVGDRNLYTFGTDGVAGAIADVYRGHGADGAQVVVKIPRQPSSNARMDAERDALLDIVRSGDGGHEWLRAYFPAFVDRVEHRDPATRERRNINVLGDVGAGFVTLAQVRAAYPDGLDPRDYAWMHRRLLRTIAAAHRAGWVHRAIDSDNVLIEPERHGVVLVGWSSATRIGDVAAESSTSVGLPPEATSGKAVSGGWDVYQVHGLMLDLLGPRAPKRLRSFANGCRQSDPRNRPDAVDLLTEFDDLLEELYGRRRFRPFVMPGSSAG